MGRKFDNVIALYMDAVNDGHVLPAADKYLTSDFTDVFPPAAVHRTSSPGAAHVTGRPTGREGFVETYEPLVRRFRDRYVRPVRGFEDGTRVFLHSYHSFGRGMIRHVCADVFETDADDRVTDRWNITAPVVFRTRTGRSQIDGPARVLDQGHTAGNKALVAEFVDAVLVSGRRDRLADYLDQHTYSDHSPDVPEGLHGFQHYLARYADAGTPVRYDAPTLLVGSGNFVATLSTASRGAHHYQVFDIFRCADELIVEHWDAIAETPVSGEHAIPVVGFEQSNPVCRMRPSGR